MRAEDLDEQFPIVDVDSDALDAARMIAEHSLPGLIVSDASQKPYAVLLASEVLHLILPRYVQDDITLAGVMGDALADHAQNLAGKTVGDVLPKPARRNPLRRCARRRHQGGRGDGAAAVSPDRSDQERNAARCDNRLTAAGRRAQILSPVRRPRCRFSRPFRTQPEKALTPVPLTVSSQQTYCVGVRAEDLDEKFPVVKIDSNALDAVRLLAEHRLNGLVVVTDTSETPFAVLPASQVVRFIVPGYVQDDPGLASVVTESMADHAAEKLSGKTIRDMLPKQRQHIPVAEADDTIIEVAEVMARLRSPLVAVVKDGRLHGVITASRLLAAALKE